MASIFSRVLRITYPAVVAAAATSLAWTHSVHHHSMTTLPLEAPNPAYSSTHIEERVVELRTSEEADTTHTEIANRAST